MESLQLNSKFEDAIGRNFFKGFPNGEYSVIQKMDKFIQLLKAVVEYTPDLG